MSRKMPRRLVALSSSAVAAIYFAGLLQTRVAAQTVSAVASGATTQVSSAVSSAAQTSTPSVVVGATATASASSSSGLQDGTFTGTGSGRFGSITVSVTTSGGKIANVQITKAATTFPVSQIASLPAQVVQTQSTSVNAVTGATASSQAFKQAVQQALLQATATATTATA